MSRYPSDGFFSKWKCRSGGSCYRASSDRVVIIPLVPSQSTIYIETFRTQRSALTMPARGKKRPILDILSDFQVAEVDWEVDCLVLMDELLQAPNAWPFRAAAIKPDKGAQHGTLDSIKARLISREYPNALEWATDVRRLLSSYLPQKDEKETGGSFPKLNSASTLDKDLGADVEYTDKWVSFACSSVPSLLVDFGDVISIIF